MELLRSYRSGIMALSQPKVPVWHTVPYCPTFSKYHTVPLSAHHSTKTALLCIHDHLITSKMTGLQRGIR